MVISKGSYKLLFANLSTFGQFFTVSLGVDVGKVEAWQSTSIIKGSGAFSTAGFSDRIAK